jgi:hypothetical protein
VFGAKTRKTNGKRVLDFDISKLIRLGQTYEVAIDVKVVKDGDESEQSTGSDWTDWTDVGQDEHISSDESDVGITNSDDGRNENCNLEPKNNEEITPKIDVQDDEHTVHPPEAPDPILKVEDENTAKLREYDRLSALARKKSKDTPQGKEWEI